jgi:hypothetical protein
LASCSLKEGKALTRPVAPGLDFETWQSIDIDEITPY